MSKVIGSSIGYNNKNGHGLSNRCTYCNLDNVGGDHDCEDYAKDLELAFERDNLPEPSPWSLATFHGLTAHDRQYV